ncbi:unnamed protein product [Boreogadus saida]
MNRLRQVLRRLSLFHKRENVTEAFAKFPPVTEGVKVVDSSGTELDEDVFEDILKDPSTGVLTIKYDTEPVHTVASSSEPSPPSSLDSSDSQDPYRALPENARGLIQKLNK